MNIHIVLVRPIYPRNIGMCARACANLGAKTLNIIQKPNFNDVEINEMHEGAAGAQDYLNSVDYFSSLDDFFKNKNSGLKIALSSRDFKTIKSQDLKSCITKSLSTNSTLFENIYLFLGPEDDGLSNSDLEQMNHICKLPISGKFKSLNLSHACLLAIHILNDCLLHHGSTLDNSVLINSSTTQNFDSEKSKINYEYPRKMIHDWLVSTGFQLNQPKVNVEKIISRLFLESEPSPDELRILESVLQQNIRKLNERKKI